MWNNILTYLKWYTYNIEFKFKFSLQNFFSTSCFLLATPHSDGLWCSIEALFSILFSVFLKLFYFFFEVFVIIALAFWALVNTFQLFYFLFKSRFFSQELSKFTNPLSSNVVFRCSLHHTQMDATLFSCCHRVLIQLSSLICSTYKWMQPTFLLPWGVDTIFKSDLHHIQVDTTHILVVMGCWYNFQVWFAPHTMDATQLSCYPWSVDIVSKSNLQHIKWMQPNLLVAIKS
jgi:hypothetical protein